MQEGTKITISQRRLPTFNKILVTTLQSRQIFWKKISLSVIHEMSYHYLSADLDSRPVGVEKWINLHIWSGQKELENHFLFAC